MKLSQYPKFNKPSERLMKKGTHHLNDAELLAIIIERGYKEDNAIDQVNKLLKKYKSLAGISRLSLTQLRKEVGPIKASKVKALFELHKRTSKLKRNALKPTIECAEDVYNHFVDELKDKKREHLYALLLDSKNRIIDTKLISVGTLNSSLIHPREVFKDAIRHSANAIILVHNHPSGDCEPSPEDEKVTQILKEAGELLRIKVLDHVVIGKNHYKSI